MGGDIDERLFVGSVAKAMKVLEAFDGSARSLSPSEIAIRTGHGDQSALTRIMRRERQTTPGRLRRDLRDDGGIA